jgi:hypothetical protein
MTPPKKHRATLFRYGTVLRIYDNGGRTVDRYTIVPPRWAREYRDDGRAWSAIAANAAPFHPQGFGQNVRITSVGNHLGRRIGWHALPTDVRRFARQSFPKYCPPPNVIEAAEAIARMRAPSIETLLRRAGYEHEADRVRDLVSASERLDTGHA